MPATISNIRMLRGVGILADRTAQSPPINLLKSNLIYGFNGSGKSTLSRLFASLQAGKRDGGLPADCVYEFELSDGTRLSAPDRLAGLQDRILVFNADFVDRNLQWSTGKARPVFYIGREQAEAAAELASQESRRDKAQEKLPGATKLHRTAEQALVTFKRDLARHIATQTRMPARTYEAPQLDRDFADQTLGSDAALPDDKLGELEAICGMDWPASDLRELSADPPFNIDAVSEAHDLAQKTPAIAMIAELERHPEMVLWARRGLEYHTAARLVDCLFCGNPIDEQRRRALADMFNDSLDQFLSRIKRARDRGGLIASVLRNLDTSVETADAVLHPLKGSYAAARAIVLSTGAALEAAITAGLAVLAEKAERPTQIADTHQLPSIAEATSRLAAWESAIEAINSIIRSHNEEGRRFQSYRDEARLAVKLHYLFVGKADYNRLTAEHASAKAQVDSIENEIRHLETVIQGLRAKVRTHGPAADKINKLVSTYLGHSELTITPIAEGYDIHRHGHPLTGAPSDGEKTAIALCYFLATLDADGRALRDLILVIDDPISSLDTKALNYACSLLKSSVGQAAQVILMTHNLPCMNEFKKTWKNAAKSDDRDPTARLLFLDVARAPGQTTRSTNVVTMSKLLREYESEYHFLFYHVVQFEAAGDKSEYFHMMPNTLRRVLDVFLAFKCPGGAGLTSKIDELCAAYKELDRAQLGAIDRLVQTESHSDNLDDLLSFSSMTIEEAHEAAKTLLAMMRKVDPTHTDRLLRLCK
jgi:wobble nucleotide-excising tRNase